MTVEPVPFDGWDQLGGKPDALLNVDGLHATGLFAQYVPLLFELKIPSELLR